MTPPTTQWLSAAELSRMLVVGPERLLAYASRGDLPCKWNQQGKPLFDADYAATLFRGRGVALEATSPHFLGVLGSTRLGRAMPEAPASLAESATPRELRALRRRAA